MANTENIEAKLAAYVDGELDAADRAEIEQHLAANEQHRKLIAELREARQYLRELPHEQAPPEVAEMLNAQLERAALLGDVELGGTAGGGSEMRINRWPQIRAVAAILMLTLGLAGLIYWVLPSPKAPPQQVAIVTPESGATTAPPLRAASPDDLIRADAPASGGAGANALAMKQVKEESIAPTPAESRPGRIIASAEASTDTRVAEGSVNGKPTISADDSRKQIELAKRDETTSTAMGGAPVQAMPGAVAAADLDRLKTAELDKALPPDAAGARAYLLVSAADTSQAMGQVVRYLDDNKIEYRSVGAASDSADAAQQGAVGDRDATSAMESEKSRSSASENKRSPAAASHPHAAGPDIFASRSMPTTIPEGEAMATSGAASNSPQVGTGAALPENRETRAPAAVAAAPLSSTAPAMPEQATVTEANVPTDREAQTRLRDKLQQVQTPSGDAVAPPGSQLLYARNITRQQAAALCSAISQPAANQVAQVVLPAEAQSSAAPPTMPAVSADQSAPFQSGEALRCRSADGSVSETLTIDDDGNVNVPQVGVTPAAGLTPAQLAESLTGKTSVAMQQVVTKDQGWSVERVAPEAALGGKLAKDAGNLKIPSTEPADQLAAAPATQPAGAPDERVDLVIVVRSSPQADAGAKAPAVLDEKQPAAPATRPATQPAPR
jgi:protein involved in polysaccharide export with SLBB domain